MKKNKIKKGDQVQIISGNNKGKIGEVLKMIPVKNRILVRGINIIKKHIKASNQKPQGGIIEKEGSIHVSNVLLLDKTIGKGTKIKYIFQDGKKNRISKKSGTLI